MQNFYKKLIASMALVLVVVVASACSPVSQRVALSSPKPGKGAESFIKNEEVIFAESDCYESNYKYPYTGYPLVDQKIKEAWVHRYYEKTVSDFMLACKGDDIMRQVLNMDYEAFAPSKNVLSFLFLPMVDTGGAHPRHDVGTMNFSVPSGKLLAYDDVLDSTNGLYQFLSSYVTKTLKPRLGQTWNNTPDFAKGVAPSSENFKNFVLTPDGITLIFPPYQIAPYSEGTIRCEVPLSELARFKPRYGIWQ